MGVCTPSEATCTLSYILLYSAGDHASPNFAAAVSPKKMGESMTYVMIVITWESKVVIRSMTEL